MVVVFDVGSVWCCFCVILHIHLLLVFCNFNIFLLFSPLPLPLLSPTDNKLGDDGAKAIAPHLPKGLVYLGLICESLVLLVTKMMIDRSIDGGGVQLLLEVCVCLFLLVIAKVAM